MVLGLRWLSVAGVFTALIALLSLIAYSQWGTTGDAREFQYRYRPLRMGTQIEIVNGTRVLGRCSLGFPAYYEVPRTADWIVVVYDVVTASHCGYAGNSVYQNVTRSNNYIGYMRDEGRIDYRNVVNTNVPDATFIVVESYTYRTGDPRPPPQIVSYYIHHLGSTLIISNYARSEAYIRSILSYPLIGKAGRTSGYEAGNITRLTDEMIRDIGCLIVDSDRIFCYTYRYGWVFLINAYGGPGDSGGPLYIRYRSFALVLGITVAGAPPDFSWADCVNATYTTNLCSPTAVNPLCNITNALGLIPYSYSG